MINALMLFLLITLGVFGGMLFGAYASTTLTDCNVVSVRLGDNKYLKIFKGINDDVYVMHKTFNKTDDFVSFDKSGHINRIIGKYVKLIRKG